MTTRPVSLHPHVLSLAPTCPVTSAKRPVRVQGSGIRNQEPRKRNIPYNDTWHTGAERRLVASPRLNRLNILNRSNGIVRQRRAPSILRPHSLGPCRQPPTNNREPHPVPRFVPPPGLSPSPLSRAAQGFLTKYRRRPVLVSSRLAPASPGRQRRHLHRSARSSLTDPPRSRPSTACSLSFRSLTAAPRPRFVPGPSLPPPPHLLPGPDFVGSCPVVVEARAPPPPPLLPLPPAAATFCCGAASCRCTRAFFANAPMRRRPSTACSVFSPGL